MVAIRPQDWHALPTPPITSPPAVIRFAPQASHAHLEAGPGRTEGCFFSP